MRRIRRWGLRIGLALPHLLLTIGTALSVSAGGQTWQHRAGALGLAGIGFAWLLLTDTVAPVSWRHRLWAQVMSFIGLIAIASLLVYRDIFFIIFMVTGLFHAIRLKPRAVMWSTLATASPALNVVSFGGPARAVNDKPFFVLAIVALHTSRSAADR